MLIQCTCGKKFKLSDEHVGRRVKCACGRVFFATPADDAWTSSGDDPLANIPNEVLLPNTVPVLSAAISPPAKPAARPKDRQWIWYGVAGVAVLLFLSGGAWALHAAFGRSNAVQVSTPDLATATAAPTLPPAPATETAAPEAPSKPVEPAPAPVAEKPAAKPAEDPNTNPLLDDLRKKKETLAKDIESRIEEARSRIREAGYGHVVVGKVNIEAPASPRDVIAQVEVLDDGSFVEAVSTAAVPIPFWYPGYAPAEALPQGPKEGDIERLPDVLLKVTKDPHPQITGQALENGSEIPKNVTFQHSLSLQAMNRVGKDISTVMKRLADDLSKHYKMESHYDSQNGQFVVTLPPIRSTLMLRSDKNAIHAFRVDLRHTETRTLGVFELHQRRTSTRIPLKDLNPKEDGTPEVDRLLKRLKANFVLQQELTKLIKEKTEKINSVKERPRKEGEPKSTVVIVGRVSAPGLSAEDNKNIVAQMRLLSDGYFAVPVQVGLPIEFRLHEYQPLDYIPQGSKGPIEFTGELKLIRTPAADQTSLAGKLAVENPALLNGKAPTISLREDIENVNWYNGSGGTEGSAGSGNRRSPKTTLQPDGSFVFKNLSPISYVLLLNAENHFRIVRSIRFQPGEKKTLEPITLFAKRAAKINYIVSPNGDFKTAAEQSEQIVFDNRYWKAAQGKAHYADFFPEQYGDTAMLRFFYAPVYITRLGTGDLDLYRNVNVDRSNILSTDQPGEINVRDGDVYLLWQGHYKQWLLITFSDFT